MSSSYSANQYDSAFRSQRLQNWCETKRFKERPTIKDGPTTFIANDRGHLLPGVVKRGSAWPDFKGTWDLPARIPARHINPTGRSLEGLHRLRSWGFDPQHTQSSSRHSHRLQDGDKQRGSVDGRSRGVKEFIMTQDNAFMNKRAAGAAGVCDFQVVGLSETTVDQQLDCKAGPASQNQPVSGGESLICENQDLQAATDEPSDAQSIRDKPASQADKRPMSRCSAAEEKPAAGEETNSRPHTVLDRAGSKVSARAASRGASSSPYK